LYQAYFFFPRHKEKKKKSPDRRLVAYKLASPEYLGCARDQPMPGPFPANPFFKGKALGTRLLDPVWLFWLFSFYAHPLFDHI